MRIFFLLIFLFSQLYAQHLYVLHGRGGEINNKKKSFMMHDVDHSVVYFTEDGETRAGSLPLTAFLKNWEKGKSFGKEPPKAHYISYRSRDTQFNEKAIILKYPRYNEADETLTFTVGGKMPKSQQFGEVALFLVHE